MVDAHALGVAQEHVLHPAPGLLYRHTRRVWAFLNEHALTFVLCGRWVINEVKHEWQIHWADLESRSKTLQSSFEEETPNPHALINLFRRRRCKHHHALVRLGNSVFADEKGPVTATALHPFDFGIRNEVNIAVYRHVDAFPWRRTSVGRLVAETVAVVSW